jgi:hypothetical protein
MLKAVPSVAEIVAGLWPVIEGASFAAATLTATPKGALSTDPSLTFTLTDSGPL